MEKRIASFTPYLLILGTTLLFFGQALFFSKTLVYRDIHLLAYPGKIFATFCIKGGIFPFWNPYIFCGFPFMAIPYHQVLYPPSIFIYLFPFAFGIDLFIILHVFLTGVFFYLLMKDQGLDEYSSLFASLSYTFSGIFLSFGNVFVTIATATWTPLLLLFYLRALRRNSIFYCCITAMVIAVEFLGGLPDFLFYDLLLLSLLSAAFIFHKKAIFPLRLFFITGLLSVGFALFQILPFLELVLLSSRKTGISFEEASLWSVSLKEFIGFFIPLFTAIPSEGYVFPYIGQKMTTSLYIGILPIFLALYAMFFIRKRFVLFFSFILIFSILLSMGKHLPLYPFLYKHLPLFSLMRNPIKALHLTSLSLSILAGFGFFYLSNKKSNIFILPTFIFLLLAFILHLKPQCLWLLTGNLSSPYETNPSEIAIFRHFLFSNCLMVSFFLLIISFLFHLGFKYKIDIKKWLIFITIIDLYTFNGRLNYLIDEEFYKEKPKIAERLKDDFNRYLISPSTISEMVKHIGAKSGCKDLLLSKAILHGNFGMNYQLFNASGYEGVMLSDFSNLSWKDLEIGGVKYIIEKRKKDIIVHQLNPYPRAFFAKKENGKWKMENGKCKIVRYEPNRVVIEAEAKKPGFLFLSDTYYPGWKCFVNGRETKIFKAAGYFRAVWVNKGKHLVEFRYFPKTFIIGLIGSIISFGMCLALLLYKRAKTKI